MYYGQNLEDKVIENYFGNVIGVCLSIGENDGKTFSNVYRLIQRGWQGTLVEPSYHAFPKLAELYAERPDIAIIKAAIGTENKEAVFFDSVDAVIKGTTSLLSTTIEGEKGRWGKDVNWEVSKVPMITYSKMLELSPYRQFDFISIDCEGADYDVLKQIDLADTDCICIEHNSKPELKQKYIDYCKPFGLTKILMDNAENIILAR